ncbi:MAG: transporter permease [Alphaproteobacteria bacterium]|nr:transporter permease [Alphaproteobacteria bacterium]
MFRSYLIVALRALAKSKSYAAINIIGLSIGIAACLIILTYVRYEFSYDGWLPNAANSYALETVFLPTPEGGISGESMTTAYVAGQAFKKDFPEAERVVWASSQSSAILRGGTPIAPKKTYVTDGQLFDVLRLPFVRGDGATALADPHSLVLSETEAKVQFGNQDPLGRAVTVVSNDANTSYKVTGVFRDIPLNSHFDATMVMRVDPADYFHKYPDTVRSWHWQNGAIYLRLRPGTDPKAIDARLPAWEKRNIPDDLGTTQKSNAGDYEDFRLLNVRDIHLSPAQGGGRPNGDRQTILTFGVVALLILAMACMNFTNLATARAGQRAREVALRKVLGARRRQLIVQFIGESVLVSAIATLVALALAEIALRPLNAFLGADMRFHYFGSGGALLPVLALTLIVGVLGGAYPAFYLSRLEPARILKANKSAVDADGNGRLRAALVVAQFAVSIGLIICTAVIYAQTEYARSVDAGYRRDGLLQVNNIYPSQAEAVMPALLDEVRRRPGIVDAARVSLGVATGNNSDTGVNLPGAKPVNLGIYGVDTHAFDTFGMRVIAGRSFSQAIAMDDSTTPNPPDRKAEEALVARGTNVILSEYAAERLGFHPAAAAVGKRVQVSMTSDETGLTPATIVGIVSDVRYRSVRKPVQPILYFYQTTGFNTLMVRFTGSPDRARAEVERVWKRLIPGLAFNARFVDDIVHDLYNSDEKRAELFGAAALLAIVIGCLGLFGLAAFTAERRTREIGIRKVLGARSRDIVRLLAWQFSKPVIVANLIAWPVAWWVMRDWLNGFDSRIALGPGPFLLAGLLALVIALGTIASHALRVARANPIHALRYE